MDPSIDRYRQLLQTNLNVAGEVLTLAHRLGVTDPDRWAAAVLAHAQRAGSANGEQVMQAARLAALGEQLGRPAGKTKTVMSLQDIRQLANDQAQAASSTRPSPATDRALRQPTVSVASVADGFPQRLRDGRPLPAAVAEMAQRLGLSLADVQGIRDALGGTFGATDAVAYLKNRGSSPLSASQASELVKTIRNAQNESTRSVSAVIDAALARPVLPGQRSAVFTVDDWDLIELQLNAQPAMDNPVARKLRSLLLSGRADGAGASRSDITRYLESVGDEFRRPAGQISWDTAVPTGNITTPDDDFARLLIVTGQTQARVDVGVVDYFSTTEPGENTRFNSQTVMPAVISPDIDHGHGTTSIVGQVGRWANITTATMQLGDTSVVQVIDRLAARGVRVMNLSQSPGPERRLAMARHPDVLFVLSAGNPGDKSNSGSLFAYGERALPNVIYVGNVDAAGNPRIDTSYQTSVHVYAPGVERRVVHGSGDVYQDKTGTSYSTPEVSSVAAKMLALCPTLRPEALRAIILQTASAPPAGAAGADGSVARAGTLNGGAAMKVVALMKAAERFGSLEEAASAMKLNDEERTRLIPIARSQIALASATKRSIDAISSPVPVSQRGASSATVVTPTGSVGVRVHRNAEQENSEIPRLTDKQISQVAGGTDDTLIDYTRGQWSDWIHAVSTRTGDSITMTLFGNSARIEEEPRLWRVAASNDAGATAKAETRALVQMLTQAQALGWKDVYFSLTGAHAKRIKEWSGRGFSVDLKYSDHVNLIFHLKRGSQSWKRLADKAKSLGIELPKAPPTE